MRAVFFEINYLLEISTIHVSCLRYKLIFHDSAHVPLYRPFFSLNAHSALVEPSWPSQVGLVLQSALSVVTKQQAWP